MFDLIIVVTLIGIIASLGAGMFFLVKDRGETNRTVISLTVRVGLAILLLIILAFGFIARNSG